MASDTKKAWDQRLTDHWAHQAQEAANDPRMCNRPSFREQVSSPLYWVGAAALGIGILISLLSGRNGSGGTIAVVIGYVVFLVALSIDHETSAPIGSLAR